MRHKNALDRCEINTLTFIGLNPVRCNVNFFRKLPELIPDELHVVVFPEPDGVAAIVVVERPTVEELRRPPELKGTLNSPPPDEDLITLSSGNNLWPLGRVKVQ